MSDEQHVDAIDHAFDAFRAGGPLAVPLGPGAVRSTVRHRRKVRTATGLALAALVVVAPTAVYARDVLNAHDPKVAASASPSPHDSPRPTVSATPTPTGTPSATPSQGPTDGRIADPGNATLPLPAWQTAGTGAGIGNNSIPGGDPKPCPTGDTRFGGGEATPYGHASVTVERSVDMDVDGDGAQETVVLLSCHTYVVPLRTVVAFDKDASGRTVALGTVVQANFGASPLQVIDDIADKSGAVRVHVGDRYACCTSPMTTQTQFQWRTYTWNGTKFVQSAGPTTFPALDPKKDDLGLFVTQTGLVMSRVAPDSDTVTGLLSFTVVNYGPVSAKHYGRFVISTHGKGDLDAPPSGCTLLKDPVYAYLCPLTLEPGESKLFQLTIRGSHATLAGGGSIDLSVGTASSLTAWPGNDPFINHDYPPHLTVDNLPVTLAD